LLQWSTLQITASLFLHSISVCFDGPSNFVVFYFASKFYSLENCSQKVLSLWCFETVYAVYVKGCIVVVVFIEVDGLFRLAVVLFLVRMGWDFGFGNITRWLLQG
jgi:hypothetical protein